MLVRTQKNMKSMVWYISIGFLIYAKISLSVYYFWYRKIYLLKYYENFIVAYWIYMANTVFFIELIVEFDIDSFIHLII
jgi:hypothetical protein